MHRIARRLRDEAGWYRSQPDEDSRLIAEILEDAARVAQFLAADTPAQYRDRLDVLKGNREPVGVET
jgi:hypothetical protein